MRPRQSSPPHRARMHAHTHTQSHTLASLECPITFIFHGLTNGLRTDGWTDGRHAYFACFNEWVTQTVRRTNGRTHALTEMRGRIEKRGTDGRTHRWRDGRTHPHIEMQGRIYKLTDFTKQPNGYGYNFHLNKYAAVQWCDPDRQTDTHTHIWLVGQWDRPAWTDFYETFIIVNFLTQI